jgi:hypothetical protein
MQALVEGPVERICFREPTLIRGRCCVFEGARDLFERRLEIAVELDQWDVPGLDAFELDRKSVV